MAKIVLFEVLKERQVMKYFNRQLIFSSKRLGIPTAFMIAMGLLIAAPLGQVEAQDVVVEGPLAGRPAVINMRLYREHRIQIQPQVSMTLQDEYSRAFQVGAQVHFFFTDWLGVGGFFNYAVGNVNTGLTGEVETKGVSNPRNRLSLPAVDGNTGQGGARNFGEQIGRWNWNAGLQLDFIPFRGKLSFFEKLFVDADLHFFAGLAFVSLSERADASVNFFGSDAMPSNVDGECGNPDDGGPDDAASLACLAATQTARSDRVALAPTFGLGLTMYFNDWIGLNIEWRAMPFSWNTGGTDEGGHRRGPFPDNRINAEDRVFHFNQMLTIGAVIYLPTEPNISD